MARSVIINGVTYPDVSSVDIPGTTSGTTVKFYETSDATGSASDVLAPREVYGVSGKITGTMTNNGAQTGVITTKAQTVRIEQGYHNGNGTVQISTTEQNKIIAGNIRSGVTILGQAGSSTVVDTTIASGGASASDILSGKKAYVGGQLLTGSATFPVISQDATTKVLSIS